MTHGTTRRPYLMRISRMTVDKLGVRLYDRVSAVVAELVANAYDADAGRVSVRVPLATHLARKDPSTGEVTDYGHVIEVQDDGHGMTPQEANEHFLRVGKDRRADPGQGGESRSKGRPVMGRKGIGKLAPFGICKRIEIVSAGGAPDENGYRVAHFVMDYDKILKDDDQPVEMDRGELDRSYRAESGTLVRLIGFLPKRVPNKATFRRQMARRFGLRQDDFAIQVEDTRNPTENPPYEVGGTFDIPLMPETKVDVSRDPVTLAEDRKLPVSGWMGLAKEAYKNEEMAGVRIYARGKIVATTRDFGQPAGFTGEFTLRSYLVGEVHAEWLDEDDGEDLVTTDRQDILWESDYGRALREWGKKWIKKIAAASRAPRRRRVEHLFLTASDMERRARNRFADDGIVATAVELGKQIGRFAAEDELGDEDYVEGLTQPDFTLVNVSRKIHIVEIKAVGHRFGNRDWDRLHNYLEAFDAFTKENVQLMRDFPDEWIIDLVCDSVDVRDRDKRAAYENWTGKGRISQTNWNDFLARAIQANEAFLEAQDQVRKKEASIADGTQAP